MEDSLERSLDARLRQPPSAALHDLIRKISRIDEFKGWWNARRLPQTAVLERLKRRVIEASTRASTRFQPQRPFFPQTARAAQTGRREEADGNDATQAAAYAELLRAVFDARLGMSFGEELILHLHSRLFKYAPGDKAQRGKYRTASDGIAGYMERGAEAAALRPTIPHLAAEQMKELTGWTASRLARAEFHPLLVIAGFVLEFLAIRPFSDGNRRLSRITINYLLLQCGYAYVPFASLEGAIAHRQAEYDLALRTSQASRNLPNPDITPWLNAFLDVMLFQVDELKAAVDVRPENGLLSNNQLAALRLLDRSGELTNRLVCAELGMSRDTAKQVLNRLLTLGLAQRLGVGRAARYVRSR